MANIPIVDKMDARKGLIASLLLMLVAFILLSFMYYEIPDPLPVDTVVAVETDIDEIVLEELRMEGGAGGGDPTDAPIAPPTPQTEQVLTNNSNTSVPTGQSNHTNANNNTNNSSTTQQNNNPFATGGNGNGEGGGDGNGLGQDTGNTSGTGNGNGTGTAGRKRLNHVSVGGIYIDTDATIGYKLTVDSQGNVISFTNVKGTTTTTNQSLINKIGYAIKKQVKFNKDPGSPLVYQFYTVHVKAT